MALTIDARQAVKDLRQFRETAIPYAIRNALNRSAFHARLEWQKEIRGSFTLRNQYTERSVLVTKASGKTAATMVAIVGSTAPYMAEQEHGATIRGKSRHKPIPAPTAAGQAAGSKRTKLVRAGNKLAALHLGKPVGATKRQRNAVALAMARRKGQKVVLLDRRSGGKGIFRLMGGRKRTTGVRLLWDLSRSSVTVKPEPTLQRTLSRIQPKLADIHRAAFIEQLKRHRAPGY